MSGAGTMEAFLRDPVAWARPRHVAPLIASGLAEATAGRLMASPRTAARASALLVQALGEGDALALTAIDRCLLPASPEMLLSVGHAAGAVCHAKRVRALVRGADISAFCARFGQAARDMALSREAPFTTVATGQLADDVARDSAACVTAFIASLPAWAAARLRLVHATDEIMPDSVAARVALMRDLAAEMLP